MATKYVITKSRSGHYTVTIKNSKWAHDISIRKLASLTAAQNVVRDYKAAAGAAATVTF